MPLDTATLKRSVAHSPGFAHCLDTLATQGIDRNASAGQCIAGTFLVLKRTVARGYFPGFHFEYRRDHRADSTAYCSSRADPANLKSRRLSIGCRRLMNFAFVKSSASFGCRATAETSNFHFRQTNWLPANRSFCH